MLPINHALHSQRPGLLIFLQNAFDNYWDILYIFSDAILEASAADDSLVPDNNQCCLIALRPQF